MQSDARERKNTEAERLLSMWLGMGLRGEGWMKFKAEEIYTGVRADQHISKNKEGRSPLESWTKY